MTKTFKLKYQFIAWIIAIFTSDHGDLTRYSMFFEKDLNE